MKKFKSILAAALVVSVGLTAFAGNYPKETLAKINAFIAKSKGEQEGSLVVTKIEEGRDKLVTRTDIAADLFGFKGEASVKLKNDDADLKIDFSGSSEFLEWIFDENTIAEAHKAAEKINKKGLYKATVKATMEDKRKAVEFVLEPASKEAVSIKKFKVLLSLDSSKTPAVGRLLVDGRFNVQADLVKNARVSLTNIFTKLANEQEPSDEDFDAFEAIIEQMGEFLDSAEDDQ